MIEALLTRFGFSGEVAAAARTAQVRTRTIARPERDAVAAGVFEAFLAEGVAESDLAAAYGYGYDDAGRARYESLLQRILGAERVLARLSLVSGTHAIVTALAALCAPGSTVIAATGRPYDTLYNAIAQAPHALCRRGIGYREIPLGETGAVALDAVAASVRDGDVVFVQRSRGYAPRRSFSAAECGAIVAAVKDVAAHALVVVDNCYGELVEASEPTHHGADVIAGSLIKNLGGGLAPGGAYLAGSAQAIERIAAYHYAPGLGDAAGPNLGFARALIAGLFAAPHAVGEALAGLDFAAALFEALGFAVDPAPGAPRFDVVQAIGLGSPRLLRAFAEGLQRALPINGRFRPEPGAVPGYREPVLMSSGAFVQGATLELSCDAPLRPPFEMYLQGGTMREHAMLGALCAAEAVVKESNAAAPQKRDG